MIFNKIRPLFLIVIIFSVINVAHGQDKPIGYWRALLPYDTAAAITTNGNTIFCASGEGLFTYDVARGNEQTYSKVEGMSDEGTFLVNYDQASSSLIIIYSDGNIDIFKNNTFYNIPDFENVTVAGSKNVFDLYTENGFSYISTSVGVIVIDLTNHNIYENYVFTYNNQILPIYSYTADQNNFYAITSNGLYRAPKNSPDLQNFQIWTRIDSTHSIFYTAKIDNDVYFADTGTVYALNSDTLSPVYTTINTIHHIDGGLADLLISEYDPSIFSGQVVLIDQNNNVVKTIGNAGSPRQSIQLLDSSIWVADAFYGLGKDGGGYFYFYYSPPGPSDPNSFDIYAYNKNVWVAHGGFNDRYINEGNNHGLSNLVDDNWVHYEGYGYAPFWDTLNDFVSIVKDETDSFVYAGSFSRGLFELHPNGTYVIYQQPTLDWSIVNGPPDPLYQVVGVALDQSNNLWVTMYGSEHELYVKEKSTGYWYKFYINYNNLTGSYLFNGGPMTFDAAGDVWFSCTYGGGVIGYHSNGTFSNLGDDTSCLLQTGVGYGNLPSNNAYCIADDLNDNLWIGTDNGIGILYGASNCLSAHCDADIPIVQYDQYAGYLFAGENVRTIAVDGANRKWVGTDNGVWLLSPDASKIIYRFTTSNSPLPSNGIQKISIDKFTGDVYIGTNQGLVSFRSTATEGGTTNQNVLVFPNPVPSGYKGTIAIRGLVTDADVRITDIKGQLVYKTSALGGQAVWDGLDYTGHRPESGVYLIFVSSADGSQTYNGKMVFFK